MMKKIEVPEVYNDAVYAQKIGALVGLGFSVVAFGLAVIADAVTEFVDETEIDDIIDGEFEETE